MVYRRNWKSKRGRKRAYKSAKRTLGKPMAKAVKKIVMSQMKQVVETKILDNWVEPSQPLTLYHNVPYVIENDLFFAQQGYGDIENLPQNRLGDSIYVKNVYMAFLMTCFNTRPNTQFRLTIVKTKSGSAGLTNPWQHPLVNNILLCPVDIEQPDIVSVVYDRVFTPPQTGPGTTGASGQDKKIFFRYKLPVNRKVKYDNNVGNTGSHSYKVFIGAYDTQATSSTDNVARFSFFRRTHFLDA